jgi:hypothetical protein
MSLYSYPRCAKGPPPLMDEFSILDEVWRKDDEEFTLVFARHD